jgi:hypothetical protein
MMENKLITTRVNFLPILSSNVADKIPPNMHAIALIDAKNLKCQNYITDFQFYFGCH